MAQWLKGLNKISFAYFLCKRSIRAQPINQEVQRTCHITYFILTGIGDLLHLTTLCKVTQFFFNMKNGIRKLLAEIKRNNQTDNQYKNSNRNDCKHNFA